MINITKLSQPELLQLQMKVKEEYQNRIKQKYPFKEEVNLLIEIRQRYRSGTTYASESILKLLEIVATWDSSDMEKFLMLNNYTQETITDVVIDVFN